jgi:hypothetical protein
LDNVQIAEINNLANKTQLKLSLEKKIKKKAGQNWVELNQSEDQIEELQAGFNLD